MATFKKLASGKWQAQVARDGIRKSKAFPTRREAQDWAAWTEREIAEGAGRGANVKLAKVFDRYAREVSPKKRGARWEQIRLEKISRDRIGKIAIGDLTAQDVADWRDRRLDEVSPSSVRREMVLMSGVMTIARKEWGMIKENPMRDVAKPANAQPRDRRVMPAELDALIDHAGPVGSKTWRTIHAFRFAIETAMRAGEICSLTPDRINGRVAHLPETKNGMARDVPLSSAALALLAELPTTDGPLFGLSSAVLSTLFRRVRDKAGIVGLTFHDSRAEALTRMAQKVDVLSLARISGHKNVSQLMTYYRETAEQLADRLG